jgi:hypothetical protein
MFEAQRHVWKGLAPHLPARSITRRTKRGCATGVIAKQHRQQLLGVEGHPQPDAGFLAGRCTHERMTPRSPARRGVSIVHVCHGRRSSCRRGW